MGVCSHRVTVPLCMVGGSHKVTIPLCLVGGSHRVTVPLCMAGGRGLGAFSARVRRSSS